MRGTVTREGTGAPIPGATVEILGGYDYIVGTATTAADGSYTASVNASSELYAQSHQDGFITELYDDYECVFDTYCDAYHGDSFSTSSGDASGIDFSLSPAGSISGIISAADTGEPFTSSVYLALYQDSGQFAGSTYTGSAGGDYQLPNLRAGSYYAPTR